MAGGNRCCDCGCTMATECGSSSSMRVDEEGNRLTRTSFVSCYTNIRTGERVVDKEYEGEVKLSDLRRSQGSQHLKAHGIGKYTLSDGFTLEGEFREDICIYGTLTDPHGDTYTGHFDDEDLPHGYGEKVYGSNGDRYTGMWEHGSKAKGTMVTGSESATFEG